MQTVNYEEIVRKCYRDLLNREPDEDGFNHYVGLLKKNEIDNTQLINIFKNSTEYKKIHELIFHHTKLNKIIEENHETYISAKPFPHIIIDDFIPENVLDRIIEEFPSPDAKLGWNKADGAYPNGKVVSVGKLWFTDETQLGTNMRQFLWEISSAGFLKFLEQLTGIQNIIPDPHFYGGGVQQSIPGAILKIHADFSKHPVWKFERRINLLFFLNRDWKEDYGGQLELWSKDMKHCEHSIQPIANRCVIFTTSNKSFHGHPHPLRCPEGMTRKSFATYYYTRGRPENTPEHGTLWQDLPDE